MKTENLPDTMTGEDKIAQENYELAMQDQLLGKMDRVDRRDRQGEIISAVPSNSYRRGWEHIWGNK